MKTVEGCVDPKLHVSMHEGYSTQDESMHAGLASMHVKYKTRDESTRREDVSTHECVRLRMSRPVRCMCRYMLRFEVRMSRSVSACVDTCCDLKQDESIHEEDVSTHVVQLEQYASIQGVLHRPIMPDFWQIQF